jgi:hypothetical protein
VQKERDHLYDLDIEEGNNIKIYFKYVRENDWDWIQLAQNRDLWRAFLNTLMNVPILYSSTIIFTSRGSDNFLRMTFLYVRITSSLMNLHRFFGQEIPVNSSLKTTKETTRFVSYFCKIASLLDLRFRGVMRHRSREHDVSE